MPQNFIECSREQVFLMPPDVRDWLPENHLVWLVLDAVEEMGLDLSPALSPRGRGLLLGRRFARRHAISA
jgi:hypothetical protein